VRRVAQPFVRATRSCGRRAFFASRARAYSGSPSERHDNPSEHPRHGTHIRPAGGNGLHDRRARDPGQRSRAGRRRLRAAAARDSLRKSRDTLETVVVKAVRSTLATPAAQSTITRDDIRKTFTGQDAPNYLNTMPSMTSYSDAGGYSGYSYLRLRGIDQTRINITLDGVPLNDPEDQVLYFSNVPDFLNSIQSVQVQRGVGSSTFGTA
jgi:outer membrane receptor protein involved in Fe transport